jgi:hypothetical protein
MNNKSVRRVSHDDFTPVRSRLFWFDRNSNLWPTMQDLLDDAIGPHVSGLDLRGEQFEREHQNSVLKKSAGPFTVAGSAVGSSLTA